MTMGAAEAPSSFGLLRADDLPPQIAPLWIAPLDQGVLPRAQPFLELLFAGDGRLDARMGFEPH